MFSRRPTKARPDLDEMLLYCATAAALATALLASGWASGSASVGLAGAALAAAGVWTGWRTRHWPQNRRWGLGFATGVLASASLALVMRWEIQSEVSRLYSALGDVGLTLALRMSVLLVGFSFLLVRREALPFSLVPAVTLFGLAGGRGLEFVAFGCFLLFLPSALYALAQAMILSGLPPDWHSRQSGRELTRWRRRHLATLGLLMTAILGLGTLIYVPAFTYGTQYYWQFAMMEFAGAGFERALQAPRQSNVTRIYSVGTGPVAPTETPVLSYEGAPASLWRGEVFDVYSGNSWLSSDDSPRSLRLPHVELSQAGTQPGSAPPATHQVRAELDLPLVIYAPGQVRAAKLPPRIATAMPEGIRVDKFGCVIAPRAVLPKGAGYILVTDTAAFTPSGGSSPVTTSTLQELDASYLRIPLGARRVADLARRVTADATTPEDRLSALVRYLQSNYVYTLDAPAVPSGQDATDYFLFRSKRGYCDLFATTLAVMARAVGVPSRFVIGYAGGQYDPESGRYLLRESDAHAWVEAYVLPYGWISADPAPAGGVTPMSPWQRFGFAARFFLQDRPIVASLLLALAVLPLAGLLLWRRSRWSKARAGLDKHDARTQVIRAYARVMRLLARRGNPRRPAQTPLEYIAALEAGAPLSARRSRPLPQAALAPVRSLTAIFLQARYGPSAVAAEAAAAAVAHVSELRQALRRARPFAQGR